MLRAVNGNGERGAKQIEIQSYHFKASMIAITKTVTTKDCKVLMSVKAHTNYP